MGGGTTIKIGTGHISIQGQPVTIRIDVNSDRGMRDQIDQSLKDRDVRELEAMLDGKPIAKRLGLRFIHDNRDGKSEPLSEAQLRHHIGLIVDDRRRTEAQKKAWYERPAGILTLVILASGVIYLLGWN